MTDLLYAWRAVAGDPWIVVDRSITLPGALDGSNWEVCPAFIASFQEDWRAQHGFVPVADLTAEPVEPGFRTTGIEDVDMDDVPTRRNIATPLTVEQVTALRDQKVAEIDAHASAIILARYPLSKQANMQARAWRLTDLRIDRPLSDDEAAERAALLAAQGWIDDVRAHSNTLKAALPPTGAVEIDAFDVTAGYPED